MRLVAEHSGEAACGSSARLRWLFALTMFLIGIVPVSQIAKAVGPAKAAPACPGATYTVVSGDSWSLIASRAKVKMAALVTANVATPATVIHPGQTLCLPSGAPDAATTTAVPTTVPPPPTAAPPARPSGVSGGAIANFPAQGLCSFTDTYGAPRAGGRVHEGVDIIAKAGQLVYAVSDGTLTKQYVDGPGSLSGNGWRLTGTDGTYFFYAHLSVFASGLTVGSGVKAGQIIGQVGMTGNAPIPHLHFEVHPGGGAPVDPTPIVRAVDGCKNTAVPPQPNGAVPALPTPTSTPTTVPTTTTPATTPPDVPAGPATTFPQHRRDLPEQTVPIRPRRSALPLSGG